METKAQPGLIEKYRVWDIRKKQMVYDALQLTEIQQLVTVNEQFNNQFAFFDGIKWMRFIHQYDKNKKEIYDGDIVKIQLPLNEFWGNVKLEKIGVIRYEPNHGGYICEWEYSKDQHHIMFNCDVAITSEVLGDIYRNPELIEQKENTQL